MSSNTSNQTNNGVGFFSLLALLLIGLKLGDVIAWSWWWVLSPILIPLALVAVIMLIVLLVAMFWR